ncbi:hypothetical protein FOE78_04590 [Microlunatus elymi]|uniref:Uncharacterized protein n=1 Tax=Microlunatus elymi TaxID=2596828 RepID=A0A516PWE6_9ACTN|nr:hypothetical protein [Microlunatus elymi]QDP95281.1 hypothetical protein FOE78_04590 [Microlunatus elymi]
MTADVDRLHLATTLRAHLPDRAAPAFEREVMRLVGAVWAGDSETVWERVSVALQREGLDHPDSPYLPQIRDEVARLALRSRIMQRTGLGRDHKISAITDLDVSIAPSRSLKISGKCRTNPALPTTR